MRYRRVDGSRDEITAVINMINQRVRESKKVDDDCSAQRFFGFFIMRPDPVCNGEAWL